ncbi:MAG: GPI anchored serine-threonine rich family protein [Bacteroidota bacterium]
MRKLVHIVFFIFLIVNPSRFWGQDLSVSERLEIIYDAQDLIRRLETLLNTLVDNNTTDNRARFLIEDSYKQGRNQIFYNGDIVIEDDLEPKVIQAGELVTDVFVTKYLNDFRLFISKSPGRGVEFTEIRELTDLIDGNYKFIRFSFNSQILNKHINYDESFPKIRRIAEVRVENVNGSWIPLIHGISYYREETPVEEDPLPIPTDPIDQNPQTPVETPKDKAAEPTTPVEEITPKEEEPGIEDPESDDAAYRFAFPTSSDVVKIGENQGVSWSNMNGLPGDVELRLVGKGEVITLQPSTNSASFNWTPQKGDVKGGTYYLEVVNRENPLVFGRSDEFKVKSKFPILIVGGAILGGAVAILCITNVICPDGENGPEPLPNAPDPEPIN